MAVAGNISYHRLKMEKFAIDSNGGGGGLGGWGKTRKSSS